MISNGQVGHKGHTLAFPDDSTTSSGGIAFSNHVSSALKTYKGIRVEKLMNGMVPFVMTVQMTKAGWVEIVFDRYKKELVMDM